MLSGFSNFGLCLLILVIGSGCAAAQDLGSSNKLFGGARPDKPATQKKAARPGPKVRTVKPKATAKARAPKPDTAKKVAVKDTAKKATETPATKPANVSTSARRSPEKKVPANTGAGKPAVSSASKSAAPPNTVDSRFKNFGGPGKPTGEPDKKSNDKPLTTADIQQLERLIREGSAARDERNYTAAEAAFTRALAIRGKDPRVLVGLGSLYADQQRWEEAEKAYRSALAVNDNDPSVRIALSYVLTQPLVVDDLGERYEEAERLARQAAQSAPRNALAFDQLGAALELRGLIGGETESAYRKAIELDSSFAPSYAHLARLLRRRGRTAESNTLYQKAIERSADVPTRVLVAEVMQSEQRFDESEKLLRNALEQDPRNPTALVLLARVLATQGKFSDSEITYRRAIDVSPDDYVPSSQLAALYLRQGKLDKAETALFDAQRTVPSGEKRVLARRFESVGDAYLKSGNRANAARCYRIASALDGDSPTLPSKLAKTVGG